MTGPLKDVFVRVESLLQDSGSAGTRQIAPSEITETVVGFVALLPQSHQIVVPGSHYSGLSNMDLLDVLRSQGRDFLQWTIQLKQHVSAGLKRKFAGSQKVPTLLELRKASEPLILEFVERRFSRGNGDVKMQPLTAQYKKRKAASGRGAQPIGVLRGALRSAFSRNARVVWR